jgi:pilus assembly protein CpaB
MNRTRLMIIGLLALGLGAFVSFTVYNTLKAKTTSKEEPGADVVIASADISTGVKIEDKDTKVVKIPLAIVPPGAPSRKSQVVGRGVVLPIAKGEFVLENKLAPINAGSSLPGLIPPGMRAVSVRVNEVVAVAGFVLPGTRVDVLLTGNPGGGSEQATTTVLENVAVIASGQKLERNSAGEPQTAAVITLLVSPDDAQKLTLASNEGRIQLSLRNVLDTKQEQLIAVRTAALYRGGSGGSAPAPTAPKPRLKKVNPVVTPPPPGVYNIEMIRGNQRQEEKFPTSQ